MDTAVLWEVYSACGVGRYLVVLISYIKQQNTVNYQYGWLLIVGVSESWQCLGITRQHQLTLLQFRMKAAEKMGRILKAHQLRSLGEKAFLSYRNSLFF